MKLSALFKHVVWRDGAWHEATTASVRGTLATLTADAIAAVPLEDIPAVIGELERLKLALSARLAAGTAPSTSENGDTLLDVDEAARLTGMSPDWLYRNWQDIPGARKLSPRALRFSRKGVEKWIAQGGRRRA
jgi:predicted DNA-binding transcriptional regulator AlpA